MLYEIVNPSDAYTLKADNVNLARAAVLLLGEGAYGLQDKEGKSDKMPLFIFGGSAGAGMKWWKEETGVELGEYLDKHGSEIAEVLRSVLIGSMADRELFEDILVHVPVSDHAAVVAKRHDAKRSSMNDIGARARVFAKMLSA